MNERRHIQHAGKTLHIHMELQVPTIETDTHTQHEQRHGLNDSSVKGPAKKPKDNLLHAALCADM